MHEFLNLLITITALIDKKDVPAYKLFKKIAGAKNDGVFL